MTINHLANVRMNFKILVINLESSADRLVSMQEQCARLGLTFERVPAVRGSELLPEKKAEVYDIEANIRKYDRLLNDGEIGCYMSHVLCWEKVISDDLDFALILEDDAILTDDMPKYLDKLAESFREWDYIKLSHGSKQKKDVAAVDIGDSLMLGLCLKLPSTTTGQLVSRDGAKKLLQYAFPIARPIDMDIQYWYEKSLRCFVARPFPVLNGDFGSEINKVTDRRYVEKNRGRRIWQKLKHEIMLLVNRGNLPKFPKCFSDKY
ncbi:glycosyltransferase family 25 protein [Shewanella indica]